MPQKDLQSCSTATKEPQLCSTSHIAIPGRSATPPTENIGDELADKSEYESPNNGSANFSIAVPQTENAPSLPHDLHHKISLIKMHARKGIAVVRQAVQHAYALAIGAK